MSLKTFFPKSVKNSKIKYIHPNRIIQLRMEREGIYNKAISEMINNPKHLQLEYISIYKPRNNKIEGIHDEKKLLLSNELNLFRQSVYNFNKKLKIKKVSNPFQENEVNFLEKYKLFKKKIDNKYFKDKEMLRDIRYELDKKDIKFCDIDLNKNLFNNNLLLVKQENIDKFLLNKMGMEKKDNKALQYMKRVSRILSYNDINNYNKALKINNDTNNMNDINTSSNILSLGNSKIIKENNNNSKNEVLDHQKEIEKINKTLKTLKNIDEFLDDKQNSKSLKDIKKESFNKIRINKSILTPQFNKSFYGFPKTSLNKSLPSMDSGTNQFCYRKKLNKSFTTINIKNIISAKTKQNKKIFYRNDNHNNELTTNKEIFSSNISDYSTMNKKELIKIKKVFLNKSYTKKITKTIDSRISTLYPNTSYDKFFIKKNSNTHPIKLQKIYKSKSVPNIFDNKKEKEVEFIYETLRNSKDSLLYDNLIKNHIKSKTKVNNYNIKNFSLYDIFHNYYKIQRIFHKEDFISKNIKMKINNMMDLDTINKFMDYSSTTNLKIQNLKHKLEQMMSKIIFTHKK